MAKGRAPLFSRFTSDESAGDAEGPVTPRRPGMTRGDQLEYLGDLVLELQGIADNLGCATLAGLLAVAHKEALIQSRAP